MASSFFDTGCYASLDIKYGSGLYHLLDLLRVGAIKQLVHSFAINFSK